MQDKKIEHEPAFYPQPPLDEIVIEQPQSSGSGSAIETGVVVAEIDKIEAEQEAALRHDEAAGFVSPVFRGVIDSSISVPQETVTDEATAARRHVAKAIEQQGFFREAPRFKDQVDDPTRTTEFTYRNKKKDPAAKHRTATEGPALLELQQFLTAYVEEMTERGLDTVNQDFVRQARSMLENLTFIGAPEMQEAVTGLGDYWKAYLDEDPNRQICVVTEVGSLKRYQDYSGDMPAKSLKSDTYIKDRILGTFTDEELEKYSGRIVDTLDDLRAEPENARIILLDDWTISGTQLRNVYAMLSKTEPKFRQYAKTSSVEINVLSASRVHLANGIVINPMRDAQGSLPIKAHFRSHSSRAAHKEHRAHVTGLHSSVNYDFHFPINIMMRRLRSAGVPVTTPALLWIARQYDKLPEHVEVSGDKLMRVLHDGKDSHGSN